MYSEQAADAAQTALLLLRCTATSVGRPDAAPGRQSLAMRHPAFVSRTSTEQHVSKQKISSLRLTASLVVRQLVLRESWVPCTVLFHTSTATSIDACIAFFADPAPGTRTWLIAKLSRTERAWLRTATST